MKTTLTLDDDLAELLNAEARSTGRSFKATVSGLLSWALQARGRTTVSEPFVVEARDLKARPGVDYNRVSELLEKIDGPLHR